MRIRHFFSTDPDGKNADPDPAGEKTDPDPTLNRKKKIYSDFKVGGHKIRYYKPSFYA